MAKKTKKTNQSQSSMPVGSKGYVIILSILCVLSIYALCMVVAIAPDNPELAIGFLVSQSVLFIGAIIMLVKQIVYMKKNHIKFQPMKGIKAFVCWMVGFVRPVHSRFRVTKQDNTAIEKQLTAFKNEYTAFYEGKALNENMTQLYRHLLMLHRNRLKKTGLSLKNQWKRMVLEKEQAVRGIYVKDGKYRHINATEYLKGKQQICVDGKSIFTRKMRGCAEYNIIGAENNGAELEGLRFACPGCGGISTAQELLEGCPYCGKSFLLEELRDRICNLSFYVDPHLEQRLAKAKIDAVVNNFAFGFSLLELIFGFGSMFFELFIEDHASLTELPFAIVITVMSLAMVFFACLGINNLFAIPFRFIAHVIYKKLQEIRLEEISVAKRNQQMLKKIHVFDKEFSMNYFFSNIRNKLAAIHFAERMNQVDVFTTTDLTPYLERYQDVVECVFGAMELVSYEKHGNYWNAKVKTTLTLLHWDGKKVKEEKEKIEMTLIKSAVEEKKAPFGVHSPICPLCGASVDLLKGNQCSYCGTKLNFTNLDWCIQSYRNQA